MCWSPFLVKLQASRTATFSIVKKRLQDMLFYESCEIFKNNFLEKHLQMAASETHLMNTKLFIAAHKGGRNCWVRV